MNTKIYLIIIFSILVNTQNISATSLQKNQTPDELTWLKKGLSVANEQLSKAVNFYKPGIYPKSVWPDMEVRTAGLDDWTCGFFPGSLWYFYEITKDNFYKEQAERFTSPLLPLQYNKDTHDLGFILYCSYGNGYRLTGNKAYINVLLNASQSLSSRFSEKVGCIRSWDNALYNYPVIIDNMMNLEMLMWASKESHEKKYAHIAESHANFTLKNHFRKDNSSFHVVDYDQNTGLVQKKVTHQGYADNSAWARGQAWGLYGYTMMYRETHNRIYLEQAKKIAAFIMNHPSLPKDKIPYWDFNAPHQPHAYRDVSAATVMASAFLELSTIEKTNKAYFTLAEEILKNLSNDFYMAKPGENSFFILKHSVGNFRNYSEIDTPINYADYYYLEALTRYASICNLDLKKMISEKAMSKS